MSLPEFLKRLQAYSDQEARWNIAELREELYAEFDLATTEFERVTLLDAYKAIMDAAERHMARGEELANFRTLRRKDYNLLLIKEATIGDASGNVNPRRIAAITRREVAAGRMREDDEMHRLSVAGAKVYRYTDSPSSYRPTFGMIGMLDYRAHKLYWLLALPLRIFSSVMFFAILFAGILIAENTSFEKLGRILIAYGCFEAGLLIFQIILAPVRWGFNKCFFWLIDIIPAHGANPDEALAVATIGRPFVLNKKFENDIDAWTEADTDEFVSFTRWRVRWFFPVKKRFENSVRELKRIHEETGKQFRDIGIIEFGKIREKLPFGRVSWVEKAIAYDWSFNAMLGLAIIVLVINMWGR